MKIKVYQINMDRDTNNVKFTGYKNLARWQGTSDIDSSLYDEVFSGEVEATDLEAVYCTFNHEPPALHRGHSLSKSDIVVTEDGAFYCDTVGFKKVDFDESLTQKPDDLIRVLYVEPNKPAVVGEMQRTLDAIQRAVIGRYEQVYMDDNTVVLSNEDAKLIGMQGNRRYNNDENIIAGPFVVVGAGMEDYESLTDEQVEKYMQKFGEPEEISDEETMSDVGFKMHFW